eukprot:941241-Heterocapsa_arctica.AAC.1
MAGGITNDMNTLPESEHMKAADTCHPCKGIIKKIDIDGAATRLGASSCAGGDCGPRMIKDSMIIDHCWEKNNNHIELKSEHWWQP